MFSSPCVLHANLKKKKKQLIYIRKCVLLLLFLFLPSCLIRKHACTPQPPLYVVWLPNENWVEDGKYPICCVFNGWILELSSYSRSAGMEQTAPICWPQHKKETTNHSFSALITVITLHAKCRGATKHLDEGPSTVDSIDICLNASLQAS